MLGLFVYLLAAIAAVALIISQKMAGNPYVRLLAKNEEHWFRTDPDGAANRVGTLIPVSYTHLSLRYPHHA